MELLQQLLRWLESNGETGFVVGGAVRDRLLGIAPEELDLALTCSPPVPFPSVSGGSRAALATGWTKSARCCA